MELIHTVYAPQGAGPHPTILTLHGRGANAFDLLGLAPYLGGGRCLLLCPQGPLQMPIGPGAMGYAWFPSTGGGPPDMEAIQRASTALRAFLDEAVQRYPCDLSKLMVLGFSQGGVMAYSLGLSMPGRFAAVMALSTWLPAALLDQAPTDATTYPPMLVQHGSRDEMIEVDRARQSVAALRTRQLPVTYREYEMGHEINAHSLGDLTTWLQERVLSPLVTIP